MEPLKADKRFEIEILPSTWFISKYELNNVDNKIENKIKKLTGLVNLFTVLLKDFNNINIAIAIPKGTIGRRTDRFMEFSINFKT